MNQLTFEQALQVLTASINKSLEKGVFTNLNDINVVMNALQVISQSKPNATIEQQ